MDVIFALDSSRGVTSNDFDQQKHFATTLIKNFAISREKTRIGVITYGGRARRTVGLLEHQDAASLKSKISGLLPAGERAAPGRVSDMLHKASIMVADEGRQNVPTTLIALVTGAIFENVSLEMTALGEQEVQVFAFGVGSDAPIAALDDIATSKHHVYNVENFSELNTVASSVARKTCQG